MKKKILSLLIAGVFLSLVFTGLDCFAATKSHNKTKTSSATYKKNNSGICRKRKNNQYQNYVKDYHTKQEELKKNQNKKSKTTAKKRKKYSR